MRWAEAGMVFVEFVVQVVVRRGVPVYLCVHVLARCCDFLKGLWLAVGADVVLARCVA